MKEEDVPAPGSVWAKEMPPEVGEREDGGPIIGFQTITRRYMERGLWFLDYVTTYEGTERQGYGTCEAALFLSTRQRVTTDEVPR